MIATVAERVRSLVPVDKKLANALAEIRGRQSRRSEIEAQFRKRASVTYFVEKLQRAEQKYSGSQSDEDLEAVCLAECLLEMATRRSGVAQAQITYGVIDSQFRSEFPDNRELLLKACELRLKVAKAEAERIIPAEQKRLSVEGFSADEIARTRLTKETRDTVERFASLLESIRVRPVEDLWKAADALLE